MGTRRRPPGSGSKDTRRRDEVGGRNGNDPGGGGGSSVIRLVALDADDTLWHNEPLFTDTQARFCALLSRHTDAGVIAQRLYETEIRNLQHYGYGVKAFTLSMVETAIELTGGRVTGDEVSEIVRMGREMLHAPVDLLEGVRDAVCRLAESHELIVVTKGDLLDQETKLARSGLGDFFTDVSVVSRKDRAMYEALVASRGLAADEFVMVGNSLRSDVVPVAEMGGHAIHVPYEATWAHEEIDATRLASIRYHTLPRIRDLPDLLLELSA